jgi:hypothetical protein
MVLAINRDGAGPDNIAGLQSAPAPDDLRHITGPLATGKYHQCERTDQAEATT